MTDAGPDADGSAGGPAEHWTGPLPDPVRVRVVSWASTTLGELTPQEVPGPLVPVARFRPDKRARLAAVPLATAVDTDEAFRRRVAARVRTGAATLVEALEAGTVPASADPVEVAAVAYLTRVVGWSERVAEVAAAAAAQADGAARAQLEQTVARLSAELASSRATAAADRDRDLAAIAALTDEVALLRRRLREQTGSARAAQRQAEAAAASAAAAQQRAEQAEQAAAERSRLAEARQAAAERMVAEAARTGRAGRDLADTRARLLLDTVLGAARGLEQELALPAATVAPADTVAGRPGVDTGADDAAAGLSGTGDPAYLDRLLALPRAHLVVDGYNVTIGAYGTLPLADQRARLLAGLAGLAARTRAEVTVVFDGAAVEGPVRAPATRGVRVLFSEPGRTADDLIRALARAEPAGRVLVVASSDREVADGVRAAGARPVSSAALVALLGR
jgi:predicted RNA-binding protein with PIN domain